MRGDTWSREGWRQKATVNIEATAVRKALNSALLADVLLVCFSGLPEYMNNQSPLLNWTIKIIFKKPTTQKQQTNKQNLKKTKSQKNAYQPKNRTTQKNPNNNKTPRQNKIEQNYFGIHVCNKKISQVIWTSKMKLLSEFVFFIILRVKIKFQKVFKPMANKIVIFSYGYFFFIKKY